MYEKSKILKKVLSVAYSCFFLPFFLLFSGCSGEREAGRARFNKWVEDNGKVKALSTTAIIDDVVSRVGGDYVDTIPLIQGELDPHSYQLVKGDDEKLAHAKIIFYNGLGLEHGPSLQHYLKDNTKAVGLGDSIGLQNPSSVIEVNGEKDPHIWMDISLWAKTIPFIVEALSMQDPVHASYYRTNGEKFREEMQEAHRQAKEMMHRVPEGKRYLVTSHDAFNYFTRAYLAEEDEIRSGDWQKRFAAPEGLAPDSQLGLTDIRAIIDHLERYRIHLLFSESNVSRDSIKKIVEAGKQKGLDVRIACCPLYGDAMGRPGSEGDSYLKMIVYNARTLASHMISEDAHESASAR